MTHTPLRLALLGLVLGTRAAGSQGSASTAGNQRSALNAAIDSAVHRVMAQRGTPGAAVAFLQGDSVLHLRGYGVTDRERGSPVTPGTVFQIASLTKPFTAAAVLLLVQDGRLSLDDRAARFLEGLPERYRSITVRQLLTHTSGVAPDMRSANVDEMSEAEFWRRFVDRPASFAPGQGFQYANAGYTLLSQIVERVSGQSFEDFLRARVFVPLRMRNSGYRQAARPDGRQATGYDLVDGVPQRAPHVFSGWGNSGIETTVEDLGQWAQALQRRTLLSEASDRAMFTPGRLAADTALNFPFRGARSAYGLGWFLTTDRGDSLFTHGGAIAGFSSVMHRLPGRGWTLIVLSNMKQGADRQGEAEAIANAIIASLRALVFANAATAQNQAARDEGLTRVDAFRDTLVTPAGHRVRTILTKPAGHTGRLPAMLFVQWLSCDPVRVEARRTDGWATMLRAVIERSGLVVLRTEKPGLDGSTGPACDQLDYNTDLATHRAALAWLRRSPHVHPDSIFIFGASMGGTMAPLLARDVDVRGVIVWGTTGLTWLEHMIQLDRRVLELQAIPPERIAQRIGAQIALHVKYLVEGRAPTDLFREDPQTRIVWDSILGVGPTNQYGRPFAFHQQAQRANWEGAWAAVRAPVLVVNGEFDWLMSPREHERIVSIVNAARPGTARLVTLPRTDHHFETFPTLAAAFVGNGGQADDRIATVIQSWVAERRRPAPR